MTVMNSLTSTPKSHLDGEAIGASEVILEATELCKSFGGNTVLQSVNVSLCKGEVVLLTGGNGAGKTTLINLLSGNIEPDGGKIEYRANNHSPRSFSFPVSAWQRFTPSPEFSMEKIARLGFVRSWQDIRIFGSLSLRDNLLVASNNPADQSPILSFLKPGSVTDAELANKDLADQKLEQLGLKDRAESSADRVSLGQAKRIGIARAVAAGAKVLFLDEPLAGLDKHGVKEVIDLLESLVKDHELTLVLVEHAINYGFLEGLITAEWAINDGTVTASRKGRNAASGSDQSTEAPRLIGQLERLKHISTFSLPGGAQLTKFQRNPDKKDGARRCLLKLVDVKISRGKRPVLGVSSELEDGLSFELNHGEIGILEAPNGWGKTSLMSAIAGSHRPDSGVIEFDGEPLDDFSIEERVKAGLRYVEALAQLFPSFTVSKALKLAGVAEEGCLPEILVLKDKVIKNLSGGQKQLTALSLRPSGGILHMFDEPFAGLDEGKIDSAMQGIILKSTGAVLIALPIRSHS